MKEKILNLLKSKLFLSLVLNLIILIFCINVSSFSYDSPQDFYNSVNISQYHYYYNNNINYILCTIVGSLQFILMGFNCFVLSQVLLSFLAFTSFTYLMTDKFGKIKAVIFTLFINILFALNHYADIQSSKTAALLLAAGFLLVLNAIQNKRYYLPFWVGIAEIILGSFFNFKYFFIALGFAGAFFFAELITRKKYKIQFRKFFWFFRPYLLIFVFITALVFGAEWYSYSVNHSSAEASNYYEYSELCDSINDLSYPDYKRHKDEFNEIGIYENEYELLKNGYYDADNSLNINSLSLVSQIQQRENTKNLLSSFTEIWSDIFTHIYEFDCFAIIIIIYAAIAVIYVVFHKRRFVFFPLFFIVAAIISSTCIRYVSSGENYLTYGIWLLIYMFTLFAFNYEQFKSEKNHSLLNIRKGLLFISAALIMCLFLTYSIVYQSKIDTPSDSDKPGSLYAEIDRHPENYYVLDPTTAKDFIKNTENYLHPLWGINGSFLNNVDSFGFLHNKDAMFRHYLPDNIYNAVLSNKKIYVIDNYITFRKEQYFKTHYINDDVNVIYSQVDDKNEYKIYFVTTQ